MKKILILTIIGILPTIGYGMDTEAIRIAYEERMAEHRATIAEEETRRARTDETMRMARLETLVGGDNGEMTPDDILETLAIMRAEVDEFARGTDEFEREANEFFANHEELYGRIEDDSDYDTDATDSDSVYTIGTDESYDTIEAFSDTDSVSDMDDFEGIPELEIDTGEITFDVTTEDEDPYIGVYDYYDDGLGDARPAA